MKTLSLHIAALTLALTGTFANASPVLSSFDSPAVFFGENHTLGYAFSTNNNVTISALGFWDSGANGFNATHQVGLWNSSGTLLGQVNLSAGTGNTLIGNFRYNNLSTAVSLSAGSTYFLAGTTDNDDWVYQGANIAMGAGFNYVNSYFVSGLFAFPDSQASSRQYLTVNALTAPVPVPAAAWLFGTAMLGFFGFNSKSRQK